MSKRENVLQGTLAIGWGMMHGQEAVDEEFRLNRLDNSKANARLWGKRWKAYGAPWGYGFAPCAEEALEKQERERILEVACDLVDYATKAVGTLPRELPQAIKIWRLILALDNLLEEENVAKIQSKLPCIARKIKQWIKEVSIEALTRQEAPTINGRCVVRDMREPEDLKEDMQEEVEEVEPEIRIISCKAAIREMLLQEQGNEVHRLNAEVGRIPKKLVRQPPRAVMSGRGDKKVGHKPPQKPWYKTRRYVQKSISMSED